MHIILIQGYLGRREPPVAPTGLASLAGQLRHHSVQIFDPNLYSDPVESFKKVTQGFEPELIGFSLRNIDTVKFSDQFLYFPHFHRHLSAVKTAFPAAIIAVGGSGFSLFPQKIMELIPEIDFGFLRECEKSFLQFIDNNCDYSVPGIYYREGEKIVCSVESELPEFSSLAPPAWDLVNLKPYIPFADRASIGIETKRGCGEKCIYCPYTVLNGGKVRLKTPLKVVDEIQYLGEECGVPQFFFTDPVFNYPLEHAKEICQEMIRRKLKIRWSAYHNVENFDAEYVRLARAAGCVEFYFSPDSATEQGLKFLRKGATTESLHRALDIISRQKGANTAFNFFAYVPSTGWKNFLAGIMFIARARLKLGKRLTRWKFSYIRLQPQTALTKILNGKDVNPDDCFPSNYRSLNALYLKHSPSIILNLILWLHYNLGRIFGSKNLLKELPPETI